MVLLRVHSLLSHAKTGYYFRARELGIIDPLLELSIGLAYIHRAVQRQADNRHTMILQGLTFIMHYYRLTLKKAENYPPLESAAVRQCAEFNVGRAFQQLGMPAFAMEYYERVIRISEECKGMGELKRDLVFEGVHNLGLMYCMSGNLEGAKLLTERYLVF